MSAVIKTLDLVSSNVEQTQQLGERVGTLVQPGDVIGLQGELGAGKTNFVQGLARGLALRDQVHSPTFILANEYRGGRMPLYHVDAYRVENAAEALGFGLDDYLNGEGVVVVEWAERIRAALPSELLWIEFRHRGETARDIRMEAYGARYEMLLQDVKGAIT